MTIINVWSEAQPDRTASHQATRPNRRRRLRAGRFRTAGENDVVRGGGGGGQRNEEEAQAYCRAEPLRHDKAGTETGAMPAKVSLKMRPTVTAGFANEVEDVNQYAAPM